MAVADDLARKEGAAAAHGTVVIAESQSAGIGRRGRSWDSEACCNLLFSLVWAPVSTEGLSPALLIRQLVQLNLAAPIAVVGACAAVGVGDARIKWPNDVWAGTIPKKLSGVLVNFNGKDAAVLGVGINVLQDMADHPSATSVTTLLQEQQTSLTDGAAEVGAREAILARFCYELERLMALSNEEVINEYLQHDLLTGLSIRVHHRSRDEDDPRDFEALVIGLNQDGMLRVRPAGMLEERVLSAEEISISPKFKEWKPRA
eukprot:CAMPEP_0119325812 /NCGR_PEP_ID=MMETSP1333-20130426/66740_1 /TAXON_ID=418940 /ORGANISM="Scyphosphaera apsteinii, Strain RCC1455" /LENGTH=259 /DNA_ID=CAMNT_0007333917 /DNA_START=149 /DNA_END=928 /DNA_ORIENTATION=-